MELNEFIKETLSELIKGVSEAQKSAKDYNATINPRSYKPLNVDGLGCLVFYKFAAKL